MSLVVNKKIHKYSLNYFFVKMKIENNLNNMADNTFKITVKNKYKF